MEWLLNSTRGIHIASPFLLLCYCYSFLCLSFSAHLFSDWKSDASLGERDEGKVFICQVLRIEFESPNLCKKLDMVTCAWYPIHDEMGDRDNSGSSQVSQRGLCGKVPMRGLVSNRRWKAPKDKQPVLSSDLHTDAVHAHIYNRTHSNMHLSIYADTQVVSRELCISALYTTFTVWFSQI